MRTLSCRDAGCDCDYIAKVETEEDVLRDAVQWYERTWKNRQRYDSNAG
jgi:predicted small metal-binding protein